MKLTFKFWYFDWLEQFSHLEMLEATRYYAAAGSVAPFTFEYWVSDWLVANSWENNRFSTICSLRALSGTQQEFIRTTLLDNTHDDLYDLETAL